MCAANKASQVTEKTFCPALVKELNMAIKRFKESAHLGLKYMQREMDTVHLRIYSDASYTTNDDLSLHTGVLVLLCDERDHFHAFYYKSKKSHRIVRSLMAGEVCAFIHWFYFVIYLNSRWYLTTRWAPSEDISVYCLQNFTLCHDKWETYSWVQSHGGLFAALKSYRRF